MTSVINANSTGIVQTGSSTAALNIQTGGTTAISVSTGQVVTITNPTVFPAGSASAPSVTASGDTDTGLYFPTANQAAISAGGTVAAAFNSNGLFFRNRIINGDMRIDQRNAGASVIPSDGAYTLDRWAAVYNGGTGRFSVQQVTDVPAGFVNSLKCTVTTAASGETTTFYSISQAIEGFNFSDLGWGSANARTITISFWVKSSIAGQYSCYLANYPGTRYYCTTYTISAANTWEYKTITVAGDTSGTYATTTSGALWFRPILGAGSSFQGATANTWSATNLNFVTGSTQWIGTLNATFFITGVQFESGSVATPFERRPYGTELMLCQRYYEKSYQQSIKPGTVSNLGGVQFPVVTAIPNGYQVGQSVTFIVTKRAAPTVTNYSYNGNTSRLTYSGGTDAGAGSATPNLIGEYSFQTVNSSGADVAITAGALYFFTASAEL